MVTNTAAAAAMVTDTMMRVTTPSLITPTATMVTPITPTAITPTTVAVTIISAANDTLTTATAGVSNTTATEQPIPAFITASSSTPVAGATNDGAGVATCTCSAPPVSDPVCDSEGNTHSNAEVLSCAIQCLLVASDVKLLRRGPCDSLPTV
ncbi:uncharacterized protein LOC126413987 [Schistocerca serialis cubense]|uniref:uncharacterized protein LOC126413987 n=1 Tax=Schistocerca serialis cubense TaxID=2023355 RepID=UPI00214F3799|nr:uncharacterized protein LOC126413987 [Schistocerca serialis cubense]